MNICICKRSVRRNLRWLADSDNAGNGCRAGSVSHNRPPVEQAASTGKALRSGYYGASPRTDKGLFGVGYNPRPPAVAVAQTLPRLALKPYLGAGVISARWPMSATVIRGVGGFSLAECLIALMILSLSMVQLGQYHRQQTNSVRQQWAQRDALLAAQQALVGKPNPQWQTRLLAQPQDEGCLLVTARVSGQWARQVALQQLFCPPFDPWLMQ